MKFPYIDMFEHTGPSLVRAIRDLVSGVFEQLEIASPLNFDKRVDYMQRLLRGLFLKRYKIVLAEFKDSLKVIAGYQWTLVATKDVTIDKLCTW